jgi:hypothetical protein
MKAALLPAAALLLAEAAALVGTAAGTFSDQASVTGNTFSTVPSFFCRAIACDDFESGGWSGGDGWLWGWWHSGESAVVTTGTTHGGTYHLRLRSSTGYVDRAVNLSGRSHVHLQFWAKVYSFESADSLVLLVGPSGSMVVVKTWTPADSDNTYHFVDIDLSPYTMSSQFYVAFDANMNSTGDYFYADDMVIKVVP